jgi:hypothetical protein
MPRAFAQAVGIAAAARALFRECLVQNKALHTDKRDRFVDRSASADHFLRKRCFMIFAGLLGLALGVFMIWWGRPINGIISPRVKRIEMVYSTTICLVLAGAVAMLVVG